MKSNSLEKDNSKIKNSELQTKRQKQAFHLREAFRKVLVTLSTALLLCQAKAYGEQLAGSSNDAEKVRPARIVSLAPSNTELLYSLGAAEEIAAVSDLCDFPKEACKKEKAGSLNSVKMEKIANLHPDVVLLVNGQESIAGNLKKHGFRSLLLDNSSIKSVKKNLLSLGLLTHKEGRAKKLAVEFENSLAELKEITKKTKPKKLVFVCIWPQPLMSAGFSSYIHEGITIAGGINCTGDLPQAYPRINNEKLLMMQPDLIVLPHEHGGQEFLTKAPWTSLNAVKSGHVYVMPKRESDCLNRPTLRFTEALAWLAKKLNPELSREIDNWIQKTRKTLGSA